MQPLCILEFAFILRNSLCDVSDIVLHVHDNPVKAHRMAPSSYLYPEWCQPQLDLDRPSLQGNKIWDQQNRVTLFCVGALYGLHHDGR